MVRLSITRFLNFLFHILTIKQVIENLTGESPAWFCSLQLLGWLLGSPCLVVAVQELHWRQQLRYYKQGKYSEALLKAANAGE